MGTIKVKIISEIFKMIHSFTPRLNVIKKGNSPYIINTFQSRKITRRMKNISTKGYCSIEKQLLYAIIKKDVKLTVWRINLLIFIPHNNPILLEHELSLKDCGSPVVHFYKMSHPDWLRIELGAENGISIKKRDYFTRDT